MTIIESFNHRGHRVKILIDSDPLNPMKDWDTFSTILHWSAKYTLGREIERGMAEGDVRAFVENDLDEKPLLVIPLYMMEHGNVQLSLGDFRDKWDSGQVGWVVVTRESADAMGYGTLPDGQHTEQQMKDIRSSVEREIQQYSSYLNGDVYQYIVTPSDEPDVHNGGYFTIEDAVVAAKESITQDLAFDPDKCLAEQRELIQRFASEPQNIIAISQQIIATTQRMDEWLTEKNGWLPEDWKK